MKSTQKLSKNAPKKLPDFVTDDVMKTVKTHPDWVFDPAQVMARAFPDGVPVHIHQEHLLRGHFEQLAKELRAMVTYQQAAIKELNQLLLFDAGM